MKKLDLKIKRFQENSYDLFVKSNFKNDVK